MAHCWCDNKDCTNRMFMDGDDLVISWDTKFRAGDTGERRITLPEGWAKKFDKLIDELSEFQDS